MAWLKDDSKLKEALMDLNEGENISMITHNRKTRNGRRTAGGGIAVAYNRTKISLSEIKIRRGKAELLCVSGKIPNISRRLVIIGFYLPPKINANRREDALSCMSDAIANVKSQFNDPYIVVTGDANKMSIADGISDYPDIIIHPTGPTRGGAYLDVVASNIRAEELSFEMRPPLETPEGIRSDHNIILASAEIINSDRFKKSTFFARRRSKKADIKMKHWIMREEWTVVYEKEDAESMTEAFVGLIEEKMNDFYPIQRTVIKSTDPPWMTKEIKRRIRSRKRMYSKEERSDRWHGKKKETKRLVKEAKYNYYNKFVNLAKKTNDSGLYFKAVSRLKCREAPPVFSPCDLFPGVPESEVAERTADFFTGIADKFTPISGPLTTGEKHSEPRITKQMVEKRLRECRKPKGLLRGDVWPDILTDCAADFAAPLTHIFNASIEQRVWPSSWRLETVSVIPKKQHPATLSDTRNISCTPVFSKVLEFFVLGWLKEEVMPDANQYGGLPGLSTNHYL